MSNVAVLDDDATFVATPTTGRYRVKGTWDMYWGQQVYHLEDWRDTGKIMELPVELGIYISSTGNVYDTYS